MVPLYPPYTPEDFLLRPCDPTQHSDDWPIFTLNNASIFTPTEPDLGANLLHADANKPLVITGKLSALPASLSHLRAQKTSASERGRSEMIALHEVRSFAYGQFEDGGVQIWAAGHAGWFSISPSRRFRATYLEMEEAVSILYFVADIYADPTTKTMAAEALFRLWAFRKQLPGGAQAAAEAFCKHRRFLIDRMVQGKEGLVASRIPLYKHFELNFRDDVDDVRRRLGKKVSRVNRSATPSSQAGTKRKRPGTELEMQDESSRRNSGVIARATRSTRSATVETSAQASDIGGPSTPRDKSMYGATDLEEDNDDSDLGQQAGKGKSILRPRQSKYIPKVATVETDADDFEPPLSPVRRLAVADEIPQGKGKIKAGAMLPPPPRARSNTTDAFHDGQAIAGADDVDEGIDMSLDQASELEGDQRVNQTEPLIDGKVPLRLRDQDMQATAAGDTWLCPLDGCLHKVYAAQTAESQQLIKEHYRLHVTDDDANMRMQLLQRMAAPGLPVSRLMDKIQNRLGQGVYPAPIHRRY
ncbi:hypothetical protein MBLNU457_5874t1 [Dothideomycetes sp. NU457]